MTPQPTDRHRFVRAELSRMGREAYSKIHQAIANGECDDLLNSLESAQLALLAEHFPDWRPIETFDKRTKAVLVFCSERENKYAVVWRDGGWKHFSQGNFPLLEFPTHWMPMPPNPQPQTSKEAE